MQYSTLEIHEESQNLRIIITPFGENKYTLLPMGLKYSTDTVQAVMESVLAGIDYSDVSIDFRW